MLTSTTAHTTADAIDHCIEAGIPFACFMYPESNEWHFMAESPDTYESRRITADDADTFEGFLITTFALGRNKHFFGIRPELTAAETLTFDRTDRLPHTLAAPVSTSRQQYLKDVADIISRLDGESEKAVYARQMVLVSDARVSSISGEYFMAHPGCFRFIYYTPATGAWLGASPELLALIDKGSARLSTTALAGTRPADTTAPWSRKNILEQQIVAEAIVDVLKPLCDSVTLGKISTRRFGNIEHLATDINAEGCCSIPEIICSLSPTPALCGHPTQKAYSLITGHECFKRGCYGGSVGVCSATDAHIYVNLRSLEIMPRQEGGHTYRIIAGGGITSHSDPQDEWEETVSKMESISKIISDSSNI